MHRSTHICFYFAHIPREICIVHSDLDIGFNCKKKKGGCCGNTHFIIVTVGMFLLFLPRYEGITILGGGRM